MRVVKYSGKILDQVTRKSSSSPSNMAMVDDFGFLSLPLTIQSKVENVNGIVVILIRTILEYQHVCQKKLSIQAISRFVVVK